MDPRRVPLDVAGRELALLLGRQQYENWLVAQTQKELDGALREVVRRLRLGWPDLSPAQRKELPRIAAMIRQTLIEVYGRISAQTTAELRAYGMLVAEYSALHVELVSPTLSASLGSSFQRLAPVMAQKIAAMEVLGLPLGSDQATGWFAQSVSNLTRSAQQALQQGMFEGEGVDQLVRRLVKAGPGRSVQRSGRRGLEAIVRTSVTAVHGNAQFEVYSGMPDDLTEKYVWISTLDTRTSPTCIGLANTTWRYKDPAAPRPPAHVRCRSTIFPLLRFYDPTGKAKSFHANGFPSMERWLRTQNKGVQNRMLGHGRAELWREGKLQLREMLNDQHAMASLGELRSRMGL